MRNVDYSPLYRSAIGFDRLVQILQHRETGQTSYPPYNIEILGENRYRITMAVAGFGRSDIEILSAGETLTISGRRTKQESQRHFVHRGIATRDFQQRFELAEHVKVAHASFADGMLHIDLVREIPEDRQPKRIEISAVAETIPAALEQGA